MLGFSPSALRTAAVAVVAGAGVSLVGLSFANIGAMDGSLAAATQHPAVVHSDDVSYHGVRDCPRDRGTRWPQHRSTSKTSASASSWQY